MSGWWKGKALAVKYRDMAARNSELCDKLEARCDAMREVVDAAKIVDAYQDGPALAQLRRALKKLKHPLIALAAAKETT